MPMPSIETLEEIILSKTEEGTSNEIIKNEEDSICIWKIIIFVLLWLSFILLVCSITCLPNI